MRHVRPTYSYQRSKDQDARQRAHHPVIIVGAGPIGLTAAIDLKLRGVPVVLLDEDNTSSDGSRAIAYARRALEVWDRIGVAQPMIDRAVSWARTKIFWRDGLIYDADVLPTRSQAELPTFINLQQYHVEEGLVDHCVAQGIDLRWKNQVVGIDSVDNRPVLRVATPEGEYELSCDWLLAADGANSMIRRSLDLQFTGKVFDEKFLICDLYMRSDFPAERWFWFDPPFNPGKSALLHMQPDGLWRIGMQLGIREEDDFDIEAEKSPEKVVPRLKAMLGDKTEFDLEWVSIYTFRCRRLDSFRKGRVLFIGDSAHQVSPFGGRGANSGVQDVDNLSWKLDYVLNGLAPEKLLDTYHEERSFAADENILNSTRATDFITPKSPVAETYRNAVLGLATNHSFARGLVNSGRLSAPSTYTGSSLNTPDDSGIVGGLPPGAPCHDVMLKRDGVDVRLLQQLGGNFIALRYGSDEVDPAAGKRLSEMVPPVRVLNVSPAEQRGALTDALRELGVQYAMEPGSVYLIRPDQHVAGRWKSFDVNTIQAATRRACANGN